jgi:hypothetical protein
MGGEMRNVYRSSVRKPEGKRPLERARHRWEDNIKMNLKEIGCENMDWIHLGEDRVRWQAVVEKLMHDIQAR